MTIEPVTTADLIYLAFCFMGLVFGFFMVMR